MAVLRTEQLGIARWVWSASQYCAISRSGLVINYLQTAISSTPGISQVSGPEPGVASIDHLHPHTRVSRLVATPRWVALSSGVICHFRVPAGLTVCTVVPNTQHSEQWLHDMHETAAGSQTSCSWSLLATRPPRWLAVHGSRRTFSGLAWGLPAGSNSNRDIISAGHRGEGQLRNRRA
jgi:hypothetical protein